MPQSPGLTGHRGPGGPGGVAHLVRHFEPPQQRHDLLLEVLLLQDKQDRIRTQGAASLRRTRQTWREGGTVPAGSREPNPFTSTRHHSCGWTGGRTRGGAGGRVRATPSCRDRPVSKAAGPRPRHHLTPAGLRGGHTAGRSVARAQQGAQAPLCPARPGPQSLSSGH